MQTTELHEIATTLRAARLNRTPVTAPSKKWLGLDADTAFEVQRLSVEMAVADGDRVVGYKLGNIAKAMQAAFGLDQPDYDRLDALIVRERRPSACSHDDRLARCGTAGPVFAHNEIQAGQGTLDASRAAAARFFRRTTCSFCKHGTEVLPAPRAQHEAPLVGPRRAPSSGRGNPRRTARQRRRLAGATVDAALSTLRCVH